MTTLLVSGLGLSLVSLAFLLAATHATRRRLARRAAEPAIWPPVSVLKPLKGSDSSLAANLDSLYAQDYPDFEVVFAIADAGDPAVAVASAAADRHPAIPTRFVLGVPPFGLNPKVSNLVGALGAARHELLLVSDANVRARPSYLRETVADLLADDAHLVSNLFVGSDEATLGAVCENLQFATFVAPGVALGDAIGAPCVVGKSMLFRRRDLAAVGGLAAVRDVLAEDYLLGRLFAGAGRRVTLSGHALAVANRERTLADFAARQLRWAQMRWRIAPFACLCEPLLLPLPFALATALAAGALGNGPVLTAALAVATLTLGLDITLLGDLRRRPPSLTSTVATLIALPLKDLVVLALWLAAMAHGTVSWQGHRFRIGRGSRLSPLRPTRQRAPMARSEQTWCERTRGERTGSEWTPRGGGRPVPPRNPSSAEPDHAFGHSGGPLGGHPAADWANGHAPADLPPGYPVDQPIEHPPSRPTGYPTSYPAGHPASYPIDGTIGTALEATAR